MATTEIVTAAVLVIGDEILSGRTKDSNSGYIAERLTGIGIQLREVRVVPDALTEIIAAVDALRTRYDYVFTTGGIGPTHDDITADAIAAAFDVALEEHPEAIAMLRRRYSEDDLSAARRRMARIPLGATLIENPVTQAPGFWIGNVIVMAGVPSIMHAMLDIVAPDLQAGRRIESRTIVAMQRESDLAPLMAQVQAAHEGLSVGSYPGFDGERYFTSIVLRAMEPATLDAAEAAVRADLERNGTELRS